jgi:glycosyltransferase involved in cell wall biosynthesis
VASAYDGPVAASDETLVFLPAWNEEATLPAVLDELQRELPGSDVLVVDDGSTDQTAAIARERGAAVVSFASNQGLRSAIATGYGYAAERDYAYCGRVDADGQHPIDELRRLLELVRTDACDVAVGSRFSTGDGFETRRYTPTVPRRFGTWLLRRSMELALGKPFLDATSGMYAANAKALPILALPYRSEAPEVEAILRLHEAGLRVDEVPVRMRPRASGDSKLRGKKAFLVVVTVIGTLFAFSRLRKRFGRG